MEDYPSPAEGNGLENRQAGKTVRGFESHILLSFGSVAQLVEQWIEAPCVGGSIPSRAILLSGCSLVVKLQPSKLLSRVRFSSPALFGNK